MEGQSKTRILHTPHLLLSIAASVGKPVINYVKTGVHDGFLIFLNPNFEIYFMFEWLESFRSKWQKYGQPGSQVNLNSEIVKNQVINLPSLLEQNEVSRFLNKFNDLIELHQRSHNMLNQKKQVLLRKMFPSLREDIPSIRFNSFEQDWKLSNLGDLGEVLTGNTPSTNMESYWEKGKNGYIWITPSDISKYKTSESMRYLSEEGWKKARKVPENSVLITSIASIGKNTINQMPAAFNQQINAIIPKENSAYFILTCMEKNKVQFSSIAGKTATPIINKTDFKKFKVKVPQHPEQLVVGDLFEKIDDILSYYQKKLDVLKKIKSIYLSKMFL